MKVFAILLLCCSLIAGAQPQTLKPGAAAPDFTLQNINNKPVSFNDYPAAKGFILIFTCNTCPYAKAYEQRIMALDKKYSPLGFPVIAINPNDPTASPGDSFDEMKKRALDKGYSFPYLYDDGQVVTAKYGARNTPHLFLVQKTPGGNKIVYTGAIDNDTQNTDPAKINFAEDAINAALQNQPPPLATTKAIGCTVKWKGN